MFGFFKKKTKEERLRETYEQVMKEAYRLSTINRAQSDVKYAEADAIMKELELLKQN